MKMKNSSSTTLLVLAATLAALGGIILSPDGRLFSLVLGGFAASVILVFGPSHVRRIVALLLLAVIILQALPALRQSRSLMDGYRNEGHRSYNLEPRERDHSRDAVNRPRRVSL